MEYHKTLKAPDLPKTLPRDYPSAAAAKAAKDMAAASTKAALRPNRKLVQDVPPPSTSRKLVQDVPLAELITGYRIASKPSIDTYHQLMVPHLQCPVCRKVSQFAQKTRPRRMARPPPAAAAATAVRPLRSVSVSYCDRAGTLGLGGCVDVLSKL